MNHADVKLGSAAGAAPPYQGSVTYGEKGVAARNVPQEGLSRDREEETGWVHLRPGLASGAPVFGVDLLGYVGACGVMLQPALLQPHHVAGGARLCSDEH